MDPSNDLKPRISVIVPAMLGYDSILAALDSWEAQTCREQLEILVLCPTAPDHPVPPGHVVVETGSMLLHEARAAGVRRAEAGRDVCRGLPPDPECAEALPVGLRAMDAGGNALRSGDPGSAPKPHAGIFSLISTSMSRRGCATSMRRAGRDQSAFFSLSGRDVVRSGSSVLQWRRARFTGSSSP
jgi:hypothetical protein